MDSRYTKERRQNRRMPLRLAAKILHSLGRHAAGSWITLAIQRMERWRRRAPDYVPPLTAAERASMLAQYTVPRGH